MFTKLKAYLVLCVVVALFAGAKPEGSTEDELVVNIKQGQLRGKKVTTTSGREIKAYLGIPYGKIIKRFQEAEEADSWKGILEASKDAPACLQYPQQFHKPLEIFGQEDCLTLNVYTPQKSENASGSWPVLVFFHGGGFVEGQGAMHLYGPQRLLNKDIVLVLMNYRVGPFGFLSTGDEASPGNYGLLDQNMALRWVKDNIEAFGGNSSKVTIAGESAGGASVIYHILSPLSKGLFHAAIHQSGSAICPWAKQPDPLAIAKNIAREPMVNCTTDNTAEMIECLRKVEATTIVNVTAKFGPSAVPFTNLPVVEKSKNGKFLIEEPLKLLQEGRFNKVPVMSAVADDEATSLFIFLGFIDGSEQYEASEEKVKGFIRGVAGLSKDDDAKLDKITNKYFHGADYTKSDDIRLRQFDLGTDAYFLSCSELTAKLFASHGVPVYYYVFDFASPGTAISNYTGHPDVGHGIVLLYLYNMTIWGPSIYNKDDEKVSEQLIDYWTTFADTGKPTESESEWPSTSLSPLVYMDVKLEPKLSQNYKADRTNFWQEIFYNISNTESEQ